MTEEQAAALLVAADAVRLWVEIGFGFVVAVAVIRWIGLDSIFRGPQ
jgi:hypothetical protein